jgi:hypothetical protein
MKVEGELLGGRGAAGRMKGIKRGGGGEVNMINVHNVQCTMICCN